MNHPLVYVMGPTCSGKSVLVDAAKRRYQEKLGLVEVGKAFRAKYPPAYFAGQANPDHTRQEAIRMYHEFSTAALSQPGVELVMVDGQPRQTQVEPILMSHPGHFKLFIHLDASPSVRRSRVLERFDPESDSAKLAMQRIDSDRIMHYDTIIDLLRLDQKIKVFDTNSERDGWTSAVLDYIETELWP